MSSIHLITVATLLFLGAVAASLALIRTMESPSSAQYKTQPVQRRDLTVSVSAIGDLEPTKQVDVGSELFRTIRTVHVEKNDPLKANQVLARLDTSKLEAQHHKNKAKPAIHENGDISSRPDSAHNYRIP